MLKQGTKLLDVKARNKAINIMWLHRYLKLSRQRPMWAYIAGDLLTKAARASNIKTAP